MFIVPFGISPEGEYGACCGDTGGFEGFGVIRLDGHDGFRAVVGDLQGEAAGGRERGCGYC